MYLKVKKLKINRTWVAPTPAISQQTIEYKPLDFFMPLTNLSGKSIALFRKPAAMPIKLRTLHFENKSEPVIILQYDHQ